ncbi:hypothetical protein JNUCC1_01558 [Lentibacillus sp. JNUCC-1]|nr:hypothetical protein [Lentibacillus sp. JNUCC-1]
MGSIILSVLRVIALIPRPIRNPPTQKESGYITRFPGYMDEKSG